MGNSSFQTLNLATQLGATPIVLIGYDMGGSHWHPDHPIEISCPDVSTAGASTLTMLHRSTESWAIEVLNASPISALTAYRKVALEKALVS